MDQTTVRFGFLGGGRMAQALVGGWVSAGLADPRRVAVHDPDPEARRRFLAAAPGAAVRPDNRAVVGQCDVAVLAVKPQAAAEALGEAAEAADGLANPPLLVSIVAGWSLRSLCQAYGCDRVVRVMPNTPCLVRCGAAAYALGPGASEPDGRLVDRLFRAVGLALPLPERLLDAVTGVSGSGPAFVLVAIEALADGGVRMGLPREASLQLAAQTVLGTARLLQETGEHPAALKDAVASPGGTTIAGLEQLERLGFRAAWIAAVRAAAERSAELGG